MTFGVPVLPGWMEDDKIAIKLLPQTRPQSCGFIVNCYVFIYGMRNETVFFKPQFFDGEDIVAISYEAVVGILVGAFAHPSFISVLERDMAYRAMLIGAIGMFSCKERIGSGNRIAYHYVIAAKGDSQEVKVKLNLIVVFRNVYERKEIAG